MGNEGMAGLPVFLGASTSPDLAFAQIPWRALRLPAGEFRVGQDEFALTQEFVARMLAVRQATMTEAAGRLQQAGLITYNRGISTVEHVRLVG